MKHINNIYKYKVYLFMRTSAHKYNTLKRYTHTHKFHCIWLVKMACCNHQKIQCTNDNRDKYFEESSQIILRILYFAVKVKFSKLTTITKVLLSLTNFSEWWLKLRFETINESQYNSSSLFSKEMNMYVYIEKQLFGCWRVKKKSVRTLWKFFLSIGILNPIFDTRVCKQLNNIYE